MADDEFTIEGPWAEQSYCGEGGATLICGLCGGIVPEEFRRTHDRYHGIMDHKERTEEAVAAVISDLEAKGTPIPENLAIGGTDVRTPSKAEGATPSG